MRVNLISNYRKHTGLSQDVNIMRGILTAVFQGNVEIQLIQYIQPQCQEADVNIFFEVVNPALFSYAAKNIWIPNHECTYITWTPYMHMMNEIWVKTTEAERIFKEETSTKVRYIGWTSLNKETPSKKNYHQALVPLGKNIYREIDPIINGYIHTRFHDPALYRRLPTLNIVSWHELIIPSELEEKVKLHKCLSDDEYNELLKECGLCICLSQAEGFGHAVNESMASGCNLIVSSIPPFMEDVVGAANPGAFFCESVVKKQDLECFGERMHTDRSAFIEQLEIYVDTSFKQKKEGSEFMRRVYETHHKNWLERMKTLLPNIFSMETPYSLKDTMPKEEELPDVSIVCITSDRRMFMPILKYSYMIQSYPEEKLELVIVDDGEDSIEDTLIGVPNVVYVRLDTKTSVGEKRNIGVSKAMFDIVTFMDDDDIYPNNSVLERVAMMLKSPTKECAFCTVIPCYDISKYSSFMNAPPITLPMSQRVSEATLIFTKKFWEQKKFENTQIAEGDAFIHGREHMCRELSPQEIIVSLVHSKNTSSRKVPEFKEPNGCHFGFNEKLFAMVSEIGESLKGNL
jgi:hypothetical protein